MKRYTFTCVLEGDGEERAPERFADLALTYGDRHQDFVLFRKGEVQVEDIEEDSDGS